MSGGSSSSSSSSSSSRRPQPAKRQAQALAAGPAAPPPAPPPPLRLQRPRAADDAARPEPGWLFRDVMRGGPREAPTVRDSRCRARPRWRTCTQRPALGTLPGAPPPPLVHPCGLRRPCTVDRRPILFFAEPDADPRSALLPLSARVCGRRRARLLPAARCPIFHASPPPPPPLFLSLCCAPPCSPRSLLPVLPLALDCPPLLPCRHAPPGTNRPSRPRTAAGAG